MPPVPKEIKKDSVKYEDEYTMAEPLKPIKASEHIEGATNEEVIRMFLTNSFPKDKMPSW